MGTGFGEEAAHFICLRKSRLLLPVYSGSILDLRHERGSWGSEYNPKSMNLANLPHQLDKKKRVCRAVVETPKGRRNKFDYDSDLSAFTLGGLLPEGLSFPFDFGFVPSTVAEDGDPIDVMILMDEPAHVGCVLDVRLIGVIEAQQTQDGKKTENDRLIGVAVHSYSHQDVESLSEVNKSLIDQVEEFFISYNKSRGKKFKVTGVHGPAKAIQRLEKAIEQYKQKS
jgi:inorganic pyrophosphatase